MSAPAIALPAASPRKMETPTTTTLASPEQDIANLAYALWQQRGCPEGSPEQDWIEAERSVQSQPTATVNQISPEISV